MDAIVNLIVGTSTTLDVYVMVRLIVVMISLDGIGSDSESIGNNR